METPATDQPDNLPDRTYDLIDTWLETNHVGVDSDRAQEAIAEIIALHENGWGLVNIGKVRQIYERYEES